MAAWMARSGRLESPVRTRRVAWSREPQKNGAQMLRIGIVAGGRIVEETLTKPGRAVTVGEHPRCTVVVPKADLPDRRFALFGPRDDGWELRFTPSMRGKLTVGGEVLALGAILERGDARRRRGVWTLPLDSATRGKVHVGEFTFLFQLVTPPPLPARDPRRFSLRRSPQDFLFSATLAFSALLHLAALLWIEAHPPPLTVELMDLPAPMRQSIFLPEDPTPSLEVEATPVEDIDGDPPQDAVPTEAPTPAPAEDPSGDPAAASEPQEPGDPQARLKDLGYEFILIGSTHEDAGGDPVADYLHDPSGFDSDVRKALLAGNVRVAVRTPQTRGPRTIEDNGLVVSDAGPVGLGGGDGGEVVKERVAPRPQVQSGLVDAAPEVASSVAAVLRPYRGRIKACYEREIKSYPDLAGKLTLSWVVAPDGRVGDLKAEQNSTGSDELAACVRRVVLGIQFPAGDEETWVDGYPLIFSPQ